MPEHIQRVTEEKDAETHTSAHKHNFLVKLPAWDEIAKAERSPDRQTKHGEI